ncbi:unnamed protein product [Fusarium graminearum]|nr:unnamed protein product [Fusarium graminearum]
MLNISRKRCRQAISNEQRMKIRELHRSYPHLRQHELSAVISREIGLTIRQSTISEITGKKFAHLDAPNASQHFLETKKARTAEYPLLEEALHEFLTRMNSQGNTVSGETICGAAELLWHRMPDFQGKPMPQFSRGWLDGFKSRYNYKKHRKTGEALTAADYDFSGRLSELQTILNAFSADDTYNADETGLFWRQQPNITLSDMPQVGKKKELNRITIFPCSNASGTHKLPLWFIGKAKRI